MLLADVDLAASAEHWANMVLIWVGFGTLVGLLAKAIMPGRDPGGAVITVAMGIGGTIIGCAAVMYFTNGQRVSPISVLGFAAATGGSFVLLFFYRLLGGRFFVEGDGGVYGRRIRPPYSSRRRRIGGSTTIIED